MTHLWTDFVAFCMKFAAESKPKGSRELTVMKFGTEWELTTQIKKKIRKVKVLTYICSSFHKISAYARKLKLVDFYKLYFPLTYNPEIVTKALMGESDSNFIGFF